MVQVPIPYIRGVEVRQYSLDHTAEATKDVQYSADLSQTKFSFGVCKFC